MRMAKTATEGRLVLVVHCSSFGGSLAAELVGEGCTGQVARSWPRVRGFVTGAVEYVLIVVGGSGVSVFLSSTYSDLAEHRKAVKEGLDRIGERVLRMESFGARPDEPTRACFTEVEESDLFIGVYAHRYGFVPPDAHASITELEYERAVELKKPVFAFIVDDDFDWRPAFIDAEPGHTRLVALKSRLRASHVIERFTSPTDLAFRVATSVSNYLAKQQLGRQIPPPAPTHMIGPENVALLHTSFRSPKADERFRDGRRYYQFEVIVMAPDAVMRRIKSVTYHLEKAWPEANRTQIIRDRSSRFKMKELANGTSIVTASIEIEGQAQPLELNRFIDLRADGPRL